jgi:hypothetical protein
MKEFPWLALLCTLVFCGALFAATQEPYRVPDETPGHYRQTDGKSCGKTGAHPCACVLASCSSDDSGNITGWTESSACHWYCRRSKCSCWPEPTECPQHHQ